MKYPARKSDVRETQGCMATPTRKRKYEEVRWSLSRSSLAVRCAGVSAFRFPIVGVLSLVAISTTHCTVHMSDMRVYVWHCGLAAWARATYQHHVNGTDTVGRSVGRLIGRSVGRCTWSRRPR